jgi:hypothetical protein
VTASRSLSTTPAPIACRERAPVRRTARRTVVLAPSLPVPSLELVRDGPAAFRPDRGSDRRG